MTSPTPSATDFQALADAQLQAHGLALPSAQVQRLAKSLARLAAVDEGVTPSTEHDFLAVLQRCRHA